MGSEGIGTLANSFLSFDTLAQKHILRDIFFTGNTIFYDILFI
jgi:hypothetical protein